MILLSAVFSYFLSTVFRLLDNSAEVLIAHKISVTPFYLDAEEIKMRLNGITDKKVRFKLKRNLFYKKLTKFFIILSIILLVAAIIYDLFNPELYVLFFGN